MGGVDWQSPSFMAIIKMRGRHYFARLSRLLFFLKKETLRKDLPRRHPFPRAHRSQSQLEETTRPGFLLTEKLHSNGKEDRILMVQIEGGGGLRRGSAPGFSREWYRRRSIDRWKQRELFGSMNEGVDGGGGGGISGRCPRSCPRPRSRAGGGGRGSPRRSPSSRGRWPRGRSGPACGRSWGWCS